jgi:elongation factor Ts
LKTMPYPGSEHEVAAYVAEMVATIGENMTVRRTASLSVTDGVVASYIHNQAAPGMGKIGVLVALESTGSKEELAGFGRLLSMHIAATNPIAMDLASVPADTLARESAILEEKNAGKPANVLEKIIASGLKTYGKENCLLEQAYVHDGTKSVTQVLAELGTKLGTPVKLLGYVRMQLGEGIEKVVDDFAAEVAKAAGTT